MYPTFPLKQVLHGSNLSQYICFSLSKVLIGVWYECMRLEGWVYVRVCECLRLYCVKKTISTSASPIAHLSIVSIIVVPPRFTPHHVELNGSYGYELLHIRQRASISACQQGSCIEYRGLRFPWTRLRTCINIFLFTVTAAGKSRPEIFFIYLLYTKNTIRIKNREIG